jgi:pyruvate/2-oxoacid:ferredoxin oxidoreductase beta subunit
VSKVLRAAILFFVFAIDINLQAEAVFYPKGCWGKEEVCAVENESKAPIALHLKTMSFHMDSQTIVKTLSENEADLARGTLLARHTEEFRWHTPFGDVLCHNCEVLLHRDEKSLEIHAIKGQVVIIRKGDGDQYDLPVGFSVELSSILSNGQANLGFPQASPLRVVGKEWAHLHSEDPNEFKKEFGEYVEAWQEAADLSSTMQRKEADRVIAADQSEQQRIEKIRQERLKEQQRLRNIFKEKNYIQ